MRNKLYFSSLLCGALMLTTPFGSSAQHIMNPKTQSKKFDPVICYSKDENMHTKVLPSADVLKKMAQVKLAKSNEVSSHIVVNYNGFSPEAEAAFQHAVDIWEVLLESPVTIKIDAYWRILDGGVLGSASATDFYVNFQGAEHANTWYPVAMAEKMAGRNLNAEASSDLYANFNSRADWYLGTDGQTPEDKTDFVSVVLHEIGHGLGFIGSLTKDGAIGSYGWGTPFPSVYDQFVVDFYEKNLTNTSEYTNPSEVLGDKLTSNQIYFVSPMAVAEYGRKIQLFAPEEYDGGSSISHLDESRFPAGNINSLMSPQIGKAEAIHDPGLALTMLEDMGWMNTTFIHEPLTDREDMQAPLAIDAVVYSDFAFDRSTVKLHYSYNGFVSSESITMSNDGVSDDYSAIIPTPTEGTEISYYLSVTETNSGRIAVIPAEAPTFLYGFKVGPDEEKPEIAHTPVDFLLSSDGAALLEATATDNIGLEEMYVELFINESAVGNQPMTKVIEQENKYSLELILGENLMAENGDIVKYRIVAVDSSSNMNTAYFPETGYQEFLVDDIGEARDSYASDFNSPSFDFLGGNGFSIREEQGFENGAIHTQHPYSNGGNENFEANYVYQLKYPIIIAQEGALMTFREVVLVEPGADGVEFGGNDFWDYVIVEGSVNNGETWVSIVDGYDSRDKSNWLSVYNSDIVADPDNASGENSIAVGDESLYHLRVINLSKVFEAGDEVQIRFRLFADQLANGWGWAIDDLKVQGDIVLSIEDEILSSINIYPNPTSGQVQLDLNLNHFDQDVHVEVLDKLGRVKLQKVSKNTRNNTIQLDMTGMPVGLYFIKLKTGEQESVHKVILTN